jgi:hypothetical protein
MPPKAIYQKPPWKQDRQVITLPTARTCPRKAPGCKVAKAHALVNDAESYLREALHEMEPKSEQEMADLDALKGYVIALKASERAMRDILLRNGTQCPDAERCRC